jgi:hypothetical protein
MDEDDEKEGEMSKQEEEEEGENTGMARSGLVAGSGLGMWLKLTNPFSTWLLGPSDISHFLEERAILRMPVSVYALVVMVAGFWMVATWTYGPRGREERRVVRAARREREG